MGARFVARERYIYGLYKNKFLIEILRSLTKYIYKNSDIILIQSPDFKKELKIFIIIKIFTISKPT